MSELQLVLWAIDGLSWPITAALAMYLIAKAILLADERNARRAERNEIGRWMARRGWCWWHRRG